MKILTAKIQTETVVKNSRFIAEAFPCQTQDDARKIIKEQKEKYFDARHVVHAFVIGLAAEIMGMSDDGEPSGTAGRPALDVLKGGGIVNILVTITRYFGGTLLGTGGLVKAYGGAVKSVLDQAIANGAVEEYIEKKEFNFGCSYAMHKSVKRLFENLKIYDLQENYSDAVLVSGKIAAEEYEALVAAIKDLSKGEIQLTDDSSSEQRQ